MRTRKLDEIIDEPEVQREYRPLYARHLKAIDLIGERAQHVQGRRVLRPD